MYRKFNEYYTLERRSTVFLLTSVAGVAYAIGKYFFRLGYDHKQQISRNSYQKIQDFNEDGDTMSTGVFFGIALAVPEVSVSYALIYGAGYAQAKIETEKIEH